MTYDGNMAWRLKIKHNKPIQEYLQCTQYEVGAAAPKLLLAKGYQMQQLVCIYVGVCVSCLGVCACHDISQPDYVGC